MVSGKTCDNGIESNDILKYGKLIMSGHFHASEIRKYSTGTIVYIGCPYEQDWGNYGDDKGFFTLDLNTMNYEFIVNNVTPKHKKLKLTELISAGEIPKYWSSEIYNNIVSFEVDRHIEPEKLTILCSKLQSMQPLSFKVDYNVSDNTTNELLSANINGIDIPTSIIEFVQLLDIDNKQEVIDYTIELYNNSTK
jgi:DNA repair exonuclease SbcCD nuclease subunit